MPSTVLGRTWTPFGTRDSRTTVLRSLAWRESMLRHSRWILQNVTNRAMLHLTSMSWYLSFCLLLKFVCWFGRLVDAMSKGFFPSFFFFSRQEGLLIFTHFRRPNPSSSVPTSQFAFLSTHKTPKDALLQAWTRPFNGIAGNELECSGCLSCPQHSLVYCLLLDEKGQRPAVPSNEARRIPMANIRRRWVDSSLFPLAFSRGAVFLDQPAETSDGQCCIKAMDSAFSPKTSMELENSERYPGTFSC